VFLALIVQMQDSHTSVVQQEIDFKKFEDVSALDSTFLQQECDLEENDIPAIL